MDQDLLRIYVLKGLQIYFLRLFRNNDLLHILTS